ncbi:MAG: hypothetical protein V4461_10525 [Pseudomonadota bacterium]
MRSFDASLYKGLRRSLGLVAISLTFTTCSALASIPSGKTYGSWHVTSISSVSGDGVSNDPAVMLNQELGADRFELSWSTGDVTLSIDVGDCGTEGFEQSSSVSAKRWLDTSIDKLTARLKSDLLVWFDQAKFVCGLPKERSGFDLGQIKPAIEDFTRRLRYFAPSQGSKN